MFQIADDVLVAVRAAKSSVWIAGRDGPARESV